MSEPKPILIAVDSLYTGQGIRTHLPVRGKNISHPHATRSWLVASSVSDQSELALTLDLIVLSNHWQGTQRAN